MSVPSVSTSTSQTNQCSDRTVSTVDRFVIHHAAMTSLSGLVSLMHGDREVSAHFAVKDSQIVSTVPPEKRAWSLGNAYWDSRAITVETCNSATGDASGWPISNESYNSLAKIAVWAHRTYGFPLDRQHIIGHREVSAMGGSYSTACPGGIDLDRVVEMAIVINNRSTEGDFLMALSDAEQREILDRLRKMHGTVDNVNWGVNDSKDGLRRMVADLDVRVMSTLRDFRDKALWALVDKDSGIRKLLGDVRNRLGS